MYFFFYFTFIFVAFSQTLSYLVPPSPLHGIHGLFISHDDTRLFVGTLIAQSIYEISLETKEHRVLLGPPLGEADDIYEEEKTGKLYFTAILNHELRVWNPENGGVTVLASDLPGVNAVYMDKKGRLFVSQVFWGDKLWEFDPNTPAISQKDNQKGLPRLIAEDIGGFNGFDVDPNNPDRLCGPIWFKQQIGCIDINTGEVTVIAHVQGTPSSVNYDISGRMWATDMALGHILLVDPASGDVQIIVRAEPSIDNIAVAHKKNMLYWTNCATASVYSLNTDTYETDVIHQGFLAGVSGFDFVDGGRDGKSILYVADSFGVKEVSIEDGEKKTILYSYSPPLSFFNPAGIAVNRKNGEIILTSFIVNRVMILKFEDGKYNIADELALKAPLDVEILNEEGDFLVTEYAAGSLTLVKRHTLETTILASGLGGPRCIALNNDKTVAYVTEADTGSVTRVDIKTGDQKRRVIDGLEQPEGITFTTGGKLLIVEVGLHRLIEVEVDGGGKRVITENLVLDAPLAWMLSDVVVDPKSGDIFVSENSNNSIIRISYNEPSNKIDL